MFRSPCRYFFIFTIKLFCGGSVVFGRVGMGADGRTGGRERASGGPTWGKNREEFLLFKIRGLSVLLSSFVFFRRGER